MSERRSDKSADPKRVTAWRIDRLRDAGFQAPLTEALARDTKCDLHALLDLVDRGYPPELAARSRAPAGRARSATTMSNAGPANWAADRRATGVDRALIRSSRISVSAARGEQETRCWIERLSASGTERDVALVELHVLLSRAARFEVNRRSTRSPQLPRTDGDDLAHQSAEDARVAVLRTLHAGKVGSRFRTWTYKFALYEAAANMRKRAWEEREIPLKAERGLLAAEGHQRIAKRSDYTTVRLAALSEAIEGELSPHQREVLVAIALNGVPIDVLAEWFNTTRGALYETLRDGRQKLRAALDARGLSIDEHQEPV